MGKSELGAIEKKVLGAMLILTDDKFVVQGKLKDIASTIGYKSYGGAITYALKVLEMNNFITKLENGRYKVLM